MTTPPRTPRSRARPVLAVVALIIGTASATAGPAAALAGGNDVTGSADAPWLVTLAVTGNGPLLGRASCGGALVAPDRVVTAAHCVEGVDPATYETHVGARVLSEDPGVTRGIRRVEVDPGYRLLPSPAAPDDPAASSATHDVAVLVLDRPVEDVTVLALRTRPLRPGTPVTIVARGTGPGSGMSDVLQLGRLTVTSDAACARQTPAVVDRGPVACAQDLRRPTPAQTVQTCAGDSGSPLVSFRRDGTPELAGVFSFSVETVGKRCGTAGFNAFGDVAALWFRHGPARSRHG